MPTMAEQTITLGGGCFWCTEAVFVRVRGVLDVESGYCNGHVPHPTYEQVCGGDTGHVEVVRLRYDDSEISLRQLLEIFFSIHDPTTLNRQGNDVGTQYRSGIYTSLEEDAAQARAFIQALTQARAFDAPIVTEVQPLAMYSAAEAYHQDYFEQHPHQGYCAYVVAPKVHKLQKSFTHWLRP
jgi:peptide-methionine (S)-S-oxide reductase